ncbi:MAG: valine--tRNA ligase, partial [Thermodesulfovibrionales bacterium]|nr:valine--tRNA ligase [Thermodesulfovibrionales bacterium]
MLVLDKSYKPEKVEKKWYSYWEKKGLFSPEKDTTKPPYCIVIPPPNVTGSLHMGHALNVTIQDILIRWKRMSGFNTLWVVGTDHAGIATQNVVEKELSKEGLDRYIIGREAFIERVWQWKKEYGGRITHQLKRLGCACDWTRERFTLDEGLSRAVREVFVRLFEEGLLYRDNRLINWCPRCHTALSELEVEHEEIEGYLYFIKYPLVEEDYSIIVATTRPETMLGDTAVAVNPDDQRYSHLIGKWVHLPLTDRKIQIISDDSVDSSFGTGALKITPAHDFNDETIAKKHGLPFITVINEDGYMTDNAGEKYKSLERYECRKRVIRDLTERGLLVDKHRHFHSVGHCYRCKTVIEPLLSVQWYIKIAPLASAAIKAVEEGRVKLIPETWNNNYFAWMRDIKDWCISRQIWWGHQIPVWYCPDCLMSDGRHQGDIIEHIFYMPLLSVNNESIVGGSYTFLKKSGFSHDEIIRNSKIIRIPKEIQAISNRVDIEECPLCRSRNLIHDPDVLDTWFSSALWPFSTLGWPEDTQELKTFYPTSVLVTAFDILFFWVARMIMMGLKFMGDVPFKDVYIHALVRDMQGQKMSKSKGNVIDPLMLIDKYGADSFRFSLASFAAQGRDIRFSEKRVEGYRHFINKLWNAAQFIIRYSSLKTDQDIYQLEDRLDLPSKWILSRLAKVVQETNREIEEYHFNDAANTIYQFVWHEFCDWYLEITKPTLYGHVQENKEIVVDCLFYILKTILLMLHPFMPYITEEIWQSLPHEGESIMVAPFPVQRPEWNALQAEERMQ